MFESLVEQMRRARGVLLTTHECPDGDGIGCLLALDQVLRARGTRTELLTPGAIPANFEFLPGAGRIRDAGATPPEEIARLLAAVDLALVVDTHGFALLGSLGPLLASASVPVLFLDHHPPATPPPPGTFCDPEASSTGELAWPVVRALAGEIPAPVATCLYAAIAYDTNSFKYLRGRAETHAIAAELVRLGADTDEIYRHLFASNRPGKLRLLGDVLRGTRYAAEGRIAWVRVSRTLTALTAATRDDLRDAVTHLLEVGGVEIAASFVEMEDGSCRVSLRSMGRHPVNPVARELGGGGHSLAAGVHLAESIDEAVPLVLARLRVAVSESPSGAQPAAGGGAGPARQG